MSKRNGTKENLIGQKPAQAKVGKVIKNAYLARKLSALEASTGKRIESVDRYWGPDGFMSLCYCWYFYDASGKLIDLIDVEWEFKSD